MCVDYLHFTAVLAFFQHCINTDVNICVGRHNQWFTMNYQWLTMLFCFNLEVCDILRNSGLAQYIDKLFEKLIRTINEHSNRFKLKKTTVNHVSDLKDFDIFNSYLLLNG